MTNDVTQEPDDEAKAFSEETYTSPKEHKLAPVQSAIDQSILNLDSVPEVSYSSSDDDDFFYDAPEESSPVNLLKPIKVVNNQIVGVIEDLDEMSLKIGESNTSNNLLDYDKMYESEEEELGSIENHGSVISHLISQVKIGMDLTKVVLPTFILERRSLLEMYADFFAHPDIFVRYLTAHHCIEHKS